MNNYLTKFSESTKVRVTQGLHKGKVGKISDYYIDNTIGMNQDNALRGRNVQGFYSITYWSWWVPGTIYVQEDCLEEVKE